MRIAIYAVKLMNRFIVSLSHSFHCNFFSSTLRNSCGFLRNNKRTNRHRTEKRTSRRVKIFNYPYVWRRFKLFPFITTLCVCVHLRFAFMSESASSLFRFICLERTFLFHFHSVARLSFHVISSSAVVAVRFFHRSMFVVIAFILLFSFSFSIQSTVLFIRFFYVDAIHRFDPFPFRVARTLRASECLCVCVRWYWFEIKCTRDNEWYSHNVDYVLWWRYSMCYIPFFSLSQTLFALTFRLSLSFCRYTRCSVLWLYAFLIAELSDWVSVCVFLYSSHLLWIPQ